MGKYIIAICAPPNTGKTTTINNVWDFLPCFESSQKVILNNQKLFEIIGYVNPCLGSSHPIDRHRRIGVNSLGDTINQVREGLAVLIHHKCDIIICATRLEYNSGYGEDIEFMLRQAINTIEDTVLHENHLDLINENTVKEIKPEELSEISVALKEYQIITVGQFCDFNHKRLPLRKCKEYGISPIVRMPNTLCGVDLSRYTAQCIVNLIEQLK